MSKTKIKTKVFALLASAAIITTGAASAAAAEHAAGCSSTLVRVICGAYYNREYAGTHVLYQTPNGDVTCTRYLVLKKHDVVCSNSSCNALLSSGQIRPCIMQHSSCTDQTGLCQN